MSGKLPRSKMGGGLAPIGEDTGGLAPIGEDESADAPLMQRDNVVMHIKEQMFDQQFPRKEEKSKMKTSTSLPQLAEFEKKQRQFQESRNSDKRSSLNAIEFLKIDHSVWMETPLVAQMGVSHRSSLFYKNALNQSTNLLKEGKEVPEGVKDIIDFYEGSTYTRTLLWNCFQALQHSLMFGYAIGVMNIPQSQIEDKFGINTFQYSWFNAIYCLGCVVGSFFGGWFGNRFGRKKFFLFNDFLWILCGVGLYLLPNYIVYLVIRLLLGFASGGTSAVIPAYLGEVSPTPVRGAIGACNQVCVCMGILISQFFAKWVSWKLMLSLNGSFAVLQLFTYFTILESPAWLIQQEDDEEAEEILRKLREKEEVDWEMRILQAGVDTRKTTSHSVQGAKKPLLAFGEEEEAKGLFARMKTDVALRKGFVISVSLLVAQQWSGINSVFFYSAAIFETAGVDAWLGTVLASTANLVGVFIALSLIERLGRKPCFILSGTLMMASAGLAVFGLYENKTNAGNDVFHWFTIGTLMVFVVGFEIGYGPIPWTLAAETIPASDLSQVQGIAGAANGMANFVIAVGFPPLQKLLQYFVYIPFVCVIFLATSFVYFSVPETKGLRVNQVQQILRGDKTEKEIREADELIGTVQ